MKLSQVCTTLLFLALSSVPVGFAAETQEKPIAYMKIHGVGIERPIHKSDLERKVQNDRQKAAATTTTNATSSPRSSADDQRVARERNERPIGYGRLKGVGNSGPIYKSDINADKSRTNPAKGPSSEVRTDLLHPAEAIAETSHATASKASMECCKRMEEAKMACCKTS